MTQSVTEISTRDIFWGQIWAVLRADNLYTFTGYSGSLNLLEL
jgi:hypothetical protein